MATDVMIVWQVIVTMIGVLISIGVLVMSVLWFLLQIWIIKSYNLSRETHNLIVDIRNTVMKCKK